MKLQYLTPCAGAIALCAALVFPAAAAPPDRFAGDGVASFDKKGNPRNLADNEGNWAFNDSSSTILFESRKVRGVTQGRLHMSGPEFVPWAASEMSGDSTFHGDYRAAGVTMLSFDARTNSFAPSPFCDPAFLDGGLSMSVELVNDAGTPDDLGDDCGVLAILGSPPLVGEGWVHFELDVPSFAMAMPPNFRPSDSGGGCIGLTANEAWNLVMQDVSQVRICWEQCDFFRIECQWDLDVDNVALDVPAGLPD